MTQLLPASEREYQTVIKRRMIHEGIRVNEVFRMQTKDGRWLTSTTIKGLPDLMGIGPEITIWCEVKDIGKPVKAEQIEVLIDFEKIETNRCWLVYPDDDLMQIARWIADPVNSPRRYGYDEELLEIARKNSTQTTSVRLSSESRLAQMNYGRNHA